MTARPTISPESILDISLALIREGGWEAVSARSLAARLGSSTMPIYSVIGSMEELKKQSLSRVAALLEAAQAQPRSANPSLDLALGFVLFAREEPRLFRFLTDNMGDAGKIVVETAASPDFIAKKATASPLAEVFEELQLPGQRSLFVLRCWIFAYGLAKLVSEGRVNMTDEEIAGHLEAAGGAFYTWESQQGNRPGAGDTEEGQ